MRVLLAVFVVLLVGHAVAHADEEPGRGEVLDASEEADQDGDAIPDELEDAIEPSGPICLRDPVSVRHQRRPREEARIALTHCDGRPNLDAVVELSLIARAWPLPRPSEEERRDWAARPEANTRRWIAEGRRRVHSGLLVRLQALADRWPERTFVVVSGHRPSARPTSRHRFGRALDLQIEGVERNEVATFAQTLAHTGVGYYPNSTFTHIDVRDRPAYWVDRSGPGEPPDYGPWPREATEAYASRGPSEVEAHRHAMLAQLEHALDDLRIEVPSGETGEGPRPSSTPRRAPALPAPAQSIRRDAFEAIEGLRRLQLGGTVARTGREVTSTVDGSGADRRTAEVDWTVPW